MSLAKFSSMLHGSERVVFLGGAGVSTESGIPDFRSQVGLFKTRDEQACSLERLLSHSFFIRYPDEFYKFYKSKMIHLKAKPNRAHLALAKLEEQGKVKAIITQNIDGLHQAAGSKNVLELHGSIHRNYCMDCREEYTIEAVINSEVLVPLCSNCNGIIRPDVTLYEEPLNSEAMQRASEHIRDADMLIIGGTSLLVNPAASLVSLYNGDRLVIINQSPTPYDDKANIVINDSLGRILESAVSKASVVS
ncbi:MAG: NAD-dependent protein deacylase [Clostridiales bacterium]|nr:NAD-dependent protein deacylase [Clostridiales bacterium]